MEWVQSAAKQGHADSQYILGSIYLNKDKVLAYAWLKLAVLGKNIDAADLIGSLEKKLTLEQLNEGKRLASNWKLGDTFKSKELTPEEETVQIKEKAEAGNIEAQYSLGRLYAKADNIVKAIEWYKKAAVQGDSQSQFMLGASYMVGGKGMPKNIAKGIEWLQKAANQGYGDSQALLGQIYYYGEDVPKDDAKALVWSKKAADQGNAKAQGRIGIMYLSGLGAPKNTAKGVEWLQKAVYQLEQDGEGNIAGGLEYMLGHTYLLGNGVPKDDIKAVKWLQKAAVKGDPSAQGDLVIAIK